jgi:hypothetical protein
MKISNATLRRLERLESRAPAVEDPRLAMEQVARQIDIIAIRKRTEPGWRPPSEAQKAQLYRDITARMAAAA